MDKSIDCARWSEVHDDSGHEDDCQDELSSSSNKSYTIARPSRFGSSEESPGNFE